VGTDTKYNYISIAVVRRMLNQDISACYVTFIARVAVDKAPGQSFPCSVPVPSYSGEELCKVSCLSVSRVLSFSLTYGIGIRESSPPNCLCCSGFLLEIVKY
jgi:hypothetical protein